MYHQKWVNPAAGSTNAFKTTFAGPNTQTFEFGPSPLTGFNGTLSTGYVDFPRNVVITVTHGSSVVAESGVITGIDQYGQALTEAWSVTAGGTSKTFTGKKAFARVTSITVTAVSDASANSNVLGTGNILGIEVNSTVGGTGAALKELSGGSLVTNGVFVAQSTAATDDRRGTYAPNTTPNGATTYEVWVISDSPETSA